MNKPLIQVRVLFLLSILISCGTTISISCHYTCANCTSSQYYKCTLCQIHRGQQSTLQPKSGMCYCDNETDEDDNGICTTSNKFNSNNKLVIGLMLGLCLFIGLVMMIIRGNRYFLLKTIQDVQELSLMVMINLYFPQQLDIFLTQLYRFNISSFMFESMASGTLFNFDPSGTVNSTDGQNIYGKYKLLYKTANFFSNSFTWFLLAFIIAIILFLLYLARRCTKETKDDELASQTNLNSQIGGEGLRDEEIAMKKKIKRSSHGTIYKIIKILYNMFWLAVPIQLFYFSLIEININIFTQINNLTFSSNFAGVGAFFSAIFLTVEIIVLFLLFLKTRDETIKPEWMRDYTYSPCLYLIRTNYKTLTKYFFFYSCIKKILITVILTSYYNQPVKAVLSISGIQGAYLLFSIYLEPLQRRHLRLHLYTSEGIKLFIYISLMNFSERYASQLQLIDVTQIFYVNFIIVFLFHLIWMTVTFIIQRRVYWYFLRKKLGYEIDQKQQMDYEDNSNQKNSHHQNQKNKKLLENNIFIKKIKKQLVEDNYQIQENEDKSANDKSESSQHIYKQIPFKGIKVGYFSEGRMYYYERQ